jgi:2-keto-4-pentenoate hydratase
MRRRDAVSTSNEIAERILNAYDTGIPIMPVRSEVSGVAAAYAIQQATLATWQARGRKIGGRKIGLTSKAVQAQLGMDEPDFGALFTDMILPSGASVAPGAVIQPRVEAEIAFVLKSDLSGERITPEAVIAATDYVCPALEICGSRIVRWDIRKEDTIADNASSGLVVLGSKRTRPILGDLASIGMLMRHDHQKVAEGKGSACLGNPAVAVAWLGETLTRFGSKLSAGDVVMSGALAKMIDAKPGNHFAADFGDFGQVVVQFAG